MTALRHPAPAVVNLQSAAAAEAALRTFWRLADAWQLSPAEQQTLLGVGRTTLYQWKQGKVGPLDRHVLERLSYLFGIHAALQVLLPVPERANQWVRKPDAPPRKGAALGLRTHWLARSGTGSSTCNAAWMPNR